MATSPAQPQVQPFVPTFNPANVITEPAFVNDISWAGTPQGNFSQPQGALWRGLVPAPGSLWGNAVGKAMVQETMGTFLPDLPPEQPVYERPQYVPGKGYVNSATA